MVIKKELDVRTLRDIWFDSGKRYLKQRVMDNEKAYNSLQDKCSEYAKLIKRNKRAWEEAFQGFLNGWNSES